MKASKNKKEDESLELGKPFGWTYWTLPLNLFIEQIQDGTVDELIYLQFLDGIKDKEQSYIQKLAKEVNGLEVVYSTVQLAIRYYEQINDPEVFAVIIHFVPGAQTTDSLEMIGTRSRKMLLDLDLKRKELKEITNTDKRSIPDYAFFTQLTLQVSKHLKFQIDKSKTTVAEFAAMIHDLRQTNDHIERELKKHSK